MGTCGASDRLLAYPSLENCWQLGLPHREGHSIKRYHDDLAWWLMQEFLPPGEAKIAKRMLDAVPRFFHKLAKLSDV
jgi:hypothetical protein